MKGLIAMYAVIFRAEINKLNNDYFEMASSLRELARNKYGCVEFTSVTEGDKEIAISYWENLESIKKWKQAPEHIVAQDLGRSQFYKSVQVQIVEIQKEYKI